MCFLGDGTGSDQMGEILGVRPTESGEVRKAKRPIREAAES